MFAFDLRGLTPLLQSRSLSPRSVSSDIAGELPPSSFLCSNLRRNSSLNTVECAARPSFLFNITLSQHILTLYRLI